MFHTHQIYGTSIPPQSPKRVSKENWVITKDQSAIHIDGFRLEITKWVLSILSITRAEFAMDLGGDGENQDPHPNKRLEVESGNVQIAGCTPVPKW